MVRRTRNAPFSPCFDAIPGALACPKLARFSH